MDSKRKKELYVCSIAELKLLENHFAKMALKGWMVDKANLFSYEYKKIDPQELQFSIDILPQITAFDYPHNEDVKEYRSICEKSGWVFAASSKQIQIFYTEQKNCMPLPIHTDEKIKAQIMLKTCLKYELLPISIAFLALLYLVAMTITKGYSIFLLNSTITQAISLILFFPSTIWYLSFILVWYFRTLLYVKKDILMPKVNYRLAKWRCLSYGVSAIISIVAMFAGAILDISGGAPPVIFITTLTPVFGFIIGLFIRKQIDTQKREKKSNIKLAIVGIVVICIISFTVTAFTISSLSSRMSDRHGLPENRLALRLEDFGIKYNADIYLNYFSTNTIAFPLNYTYYETAENGSVRTDVKKSISGFLAEKIFQELHNKFNDYEWRSATKITEDELTAWGAIDGYYINSLKTELLLLYERTVVQVDYRSEVILVEDLQEKVKLIACQ